MADKNTNLAITISTVDKATAKIKAINDALDKASKPRRDLQKALGEFADKSGMNSVIDGFKGVGSAIGDLLGKVAMIGGVVALAGAAVFKLVGEFDDLGDKAEILGVSADFLAQMRYAAEKAGAPVEALDAGLEAFSVNLGKLSAGTGRMKTFLDKVSPALEKQLKGAKNNKEAFFLLAGAMAKLEDPAKKAALAAAAGLGPELAPLLAKGPKGIQELTERFQQLAPGMQDAADKAGSVDDSLHDLHASTQGVKAAIVSGLAPALKVIVDQLTQWFSTHQNDVREFAASVGERLPAAFKAVVTWLGAAYDKVTSFIDSVGGIKTIAIGLAAILTGPLIGAIASFGIALVATPFGQFMLGITALVAGVAYGIKAIKALAAEGRRAGEWAARKKLIAQHEDEIRDLNSEAIDAGELSDDEIHRRAVAQAANDIANSHAVEDAEAKRADEAASGPAAPAAPAAPSMEDRLDAMKAAQGFRETSLAKSIASEASARNLDASSSCSRIDAIFLSSARAMAFGRPFHTMIRMTTIIDRATNPPGLMPKKDISPCSTAPGSATTVVAFRGALMLILTRSARS